MGERHTDAASAEQLAQRYRSLVEHTPDAICVHESGTIVYVNPAMVRLLGARSADDLLGLSIQTFVHPDSIPPMLARIAQLTAEGSASPPAEMDLVRVDGRTVPVQTVSVLTVWQGELAYQVVVHDLTAQRAAEDSARRAESHFTTVVSQLEEGVLVVDRRGRLESINPAGRRILGIDDADPVLGRRFDELPATMIDRDGHPLPGDQHPMARTLATGEVVTRFVFGVERVDGQLVWLSCNCRLLNPDSPDSSGVSSFADITEYRASRRQLEYQATHDALTGLANRSLILSQLSTALADEGGTLVTTVLFIDLDGFKAINDTLGHAIGDTVLQIVAQRLQRALRAEDLVGRLGGDEFLVLLAGHPQRADLPALVERLRVTMSEPIIARGHRLEVSASIGITELGPHERRTPEAVLHDADLAMYRDKPAGHRELGLGQNRRSNNTHAS
ncbi:sensor domain-containing diguanylate cyclase [Nocardia mangyaensis]|uniref:Sensor domain-containing diguanylate cyclase n=1 Tax=Nocardia mangyaensis TaxID=2213200 RepID=A0A1J0VQ95_9NOCA|nr:diguanylate cyclase [Nocardia mangyaensis]APE34211.1 sensor domain-containing diguanylate cyclase [Nocardia mangyaensis]